MQLLEGSGSSPRHLTLSITMDVLHSLGHLDVELVRVRKLLSKFRILSNFQSLIDERTTCTFLYWRKEMFSTWLSMVYGDACKLSWLQNIIDAFSDGVLLLKLANVGPVALQSYEEEIESALKEEFIAPLCRDIETDIRLHVHSTHLKGTVTVNPTKTGVRNLSWSLCMRPLRLPFKFVDVKFLVENHLNSAFYTYSVMPNYDHKIYSEMHQLGALKYGVELEDFQLTVDAQDQGFDLRKTVQDLDSFCEKYSYSIAKQMFIENDFDGQSRKRLRVLHVEHIASSSSMCSFQKISAALDYILVFLDRMFIDLGALLQTGTEIDLKEFKHSENTKGSSAHHSIQGELKFGLRKHGLGDHTLDFLKQVESVVTRIGNALGLVRILAAAYARYSNNISRYARKSNYELGYSTSCKILGWDDAIAEIGEMLDVASRSKEVLKERIQTFASLVASFSQKLQSNELKEMKDFFQIVPFLFANMVDNKLLHKGKLMRRGHEVKNGVYTYDSFLLGVAFVLKVLEQEKSFDELSWFASTKPKFMGETDDRGNKMESSASRSAFTSLKLWRAAPSAMAEPQKGVGKEERYQQEVELIECGFRLARTMLG